jgi:hypothetical protein
MKPLASENKISEDEVSLRVAIDLKNASVPRRLLERPLRMSLPTLIRMTGWNLPFEARLFFGGKMKVVLPEIVSSELYRYGFTEAGVTTAMLRHLRPTKTFFDIGAHFGYVSRLAAYLVGPQGQVVSFEPTPSTRLILESNLSDLPTVIVEPFAVWKQDGEIQMTDFGVAASAFNSFANPRLRIHPV